MGPETISRLEATCQALHVKVAQLRPGDFLIGSKRWVIWGPSRPKHTAHSGRDRLRLQFYLRDIKGYENTTWWGANTTVLIERQVWSRVFC